MKALNRIVRYLVGALFIFSGLVKLNDPFGTAYKLEEYFHVFSADFGPFFEVFIPYSLFLSIFISGLEVIMGVAMIISYRMKITMNSILALIVFFTFLTFYSYWFDKVKECGCFGTFIVLTAKQSFIKDLVLLVLILFIYFTREKDSSKSFAFSDAAMLLVSAGVFYFGYYASEHLPYIDTLNFKTGNDINKLIVPEEKPRYKFILEKGGKEYEFGQENYPSDPSYKFKRYILLNEDSTKLLPKISNFNIEGEEGNVSAEVLKGQKLLIIIPDLKKAFENAQKYSGELRKLVKDLEKTGIQPMLITKNVPQEEVEEYRHENQLAVPYYFADDVLLKMMIRSNPGIVLMDKGVVKGKWHYNDIPESDKIKSLLR